MDFFRMRILNTFLFLVLGIMIGLFFNLKSHESGAFSRDKPLKLKAGASSLPGQAPDGDSETFSYPFVADGPKEEMSVYGDNSDVITISPKGEDPDSGGEYFFGDPKNCAGSELELELKLVDIEKTEKKWRLKMGYAMKDAGIKFVHIDADAGMDGLASLSSGNFYWTRFKCRDGDIRSGNSLLSIEPIEASEEGAE